METISFLYACGMNQNGQLTLEDKSNIKYPEKVTKFEGKKVIRIAAGYQNALFLLSDNEIEQFGLITTTHTQFFSDKSPIKDIKSGQDHFIALTENGEVYHWKAVNSQSYFSDSLITTNPTLIVFDKPAQEIIGGGHSTYFLTENGDLYGVGSNSQNQISKSSESVITKPELIDNNVERAFSGPYSHQIFFIKEGKLYCRGYNQYGQLGTGNSENKSTNYHLKFFDNQEIIDVSCGYCHTLVLIREGEGQKLYTTGYFDYNGLNKPSNSTEFSLLFNYANQEIIQMSSGSQFSIILVENNNFIVFGYNDWGQLGTKDTANYPQPKKLSFSEFPKEIEIEVICGSYCTFFLQATEKFQSIRQDMFEFLQKNELCDTTIKSIDGHNISFHSLIVTLRTKKLLYEIITILETKTKDEIMSILVFLYSLRIINYSAIQVFCQEIEYPDLIGKNSSNQYNEDFADLYEEMSTKDFTIISGEKEIRAHKMILAARSELFHGMFMSVNDDSGKVHDYRGSTPVLLEKLIKFFLH
eukprot:Anaeramoba_ignava/c20917_g1_i2.p1 GENE.c20917_g1_i2~~c20917_g1_i2.p1  ORF type:complete len:527 (+),score=155.93 c20917_g1_i2:20-1600(+)